MIRHKSLSVEPVGKGQNITEKKWLMEGAEQHEKGMIKNPVRVGLENNKNGSLYG